jgi:hypothetical protein
MKTKLNSNNENRTNNTNNDLKLFVLNNPETIKAYEDDIKKEIIRRANALEDDTPAELSEEDVSKLLENWNKLTAEEDFLSWEETGL